MVEKPPVFRLALRETEGYDVSWLRRGLIEIWMMGALSALFGFLGPFGTYFDGDFAERSLHWGVQLLGAYVLVRPSILLWQAMADATALPRRGLLFWGVLLSSLPLTLLWNWSSRTFFHGLNGFAQMLPFAILCSLAVLVIAGWAKAFDARLSGEAGSESESLHDEFAAFPSGAIEAAEAPQVSANEKVESSVKVPAATVPRLTQRLPAGFKGPIVALESEDHYVRVHGIEASALILIRLRDAIAEMDSVRGEQVHRSWWVVRGGITGVEIEGRRRILHLPNGAEAQIARDSIGRLQQNGFLADHSLVRSAPPALQH